jgi:hypothetical protein
MKFYSLNEIPISADDRVFKTSLASRWVGFLMSSVPAAVLLFLGIAGRKLYHFSPPGTFFSFVFAAFFSLFARFSFSMLRASLRPTNWLLRCNGEGLLIKFRSLNNWSLPETDVQAVGLAFSEIAWARIVRDRRFSPSFGHPGQSERRNLTYIDFCLARRDDLSGLEKQLDAERVQRPNTTVFLDYPVETIAPNIVRVRWKKSGESATTPNAAKAAEYLGRYIRFIDPESTVTDLTHQSGAKPEDEDVKILELMKSGDKMAATELAQRAHRSSLTEASTYVEKLQSDL